MLSNFQNIFTAILGIIFVNEAVIRDPTIPYACLHYLMNELATYH